MSLVWVSQVQVECFIFLCCGRWYRKKGWIFSMGLTVIWPSFFCQRMLKCQKMDLRKNLERKLYKDLTSKES